MRRWSITAFVLLALAAHTSQLPGQATTERAGVSSVSEAGLRSAIVALLPQATVRASAAGVLVEGRFPQMQRDTLWLNTSKTGMVPVPVRYVDSLWTRERSFLRGALIGGAVGGVVVSGFFLFLVKGLCESVKGCSDDYPLAIGYGVVIGGGSGALIGTGIGGLVRRWQRRYP